MMKKQPLSLAEGRQVAFPAREKDKREEKESIERLFFSPPLTTLTILLMISCGRDE